MMERTTGELTLGWIEEHELLRKLAWSIAFDLILNDLGVTFLRLRHLS